MRSESKGFRDKTGNKKATTGAMSPKYMIFPSNQVQYFFFTSTPL